MRVALTLLLCALLCSSVAGQTDSSEHAVPPKLSPLRMQAYVPTPPTAFRGDGQWHLCYELHLTNLSPDTWTLETIAAVDDSGASLVKVEGAALDAVLSHPGSARDQKISHPAEIAPGEAVIAYLWIDLAKDARLPTALRHQVTVKKAGGGNSVAMTAASTSVVTKLPEIISPLHGKNWVAANGPSNTSQHRRALILANGTPYIAQRYAIDWVQIGDDGKTYHGDAKDNRSYYCFGVEAHAIADAVVVEVKDGIPENTPNEKPAVEIDFDTVAGNHINLDLGGGVYAMYAHLQPGSIRVNVGDHVTPGQILGLVGNTGNSSEPHLHFQLMNRNSPLASEGLPYALPSYQLKGKMGDDPDKPQVQRLAAPVAHHGDLPMEDEVVDFATK